MSCPALQLAKPLFASLSVVIFDTSSTLTPQIGTKTRLQDFQIMFTRRHSEFCLSFIGESNYLVWFYMPSLSCRSSERPLPFPVDDVSDKQSDVLHTTFLHSLSLYATQRTGIGTADHLLSLLYRHLFPSAMQIFYNLIMEIVSSYWVVCTLAPSHVIGEVIASGSVCSVHTTYRVCVCVCVWTCFAGGVAKAGRKQHI